MTILLPRAAIPYALLQRSDCQTFTRSRAYRLLQRLAPVDLYRAAVRLEALLRPDRVRRRWEAEIWRDYSRILPAIHGRRFRRVLDIGCGLAGIDVVLRLLHADRSTQFHLLDRNELAPRIWYGFDSRGAFYNSLTLARQVLQANGVYRDNIHTHRAWDDFSIPIEDAQVDLCLSLLSWGFHYPVSTYLPEVRRILKPGGLLILDLRQGTGGLYELDSPDSGFRCLFSTAVSNKRLTAAFVRT